MIRRLKERARSWAIRTPLRGKLRIYYIGVFVPMLLLMIFLISGMVRRNLANDEHDMETMATGLRYSLTDQVNLASAAADSIYQSDYIDRFLNEQYETPLDYYEAYQEYRRNAMFEDLVNSAHLHIVMYAENPTILNGGYFGKIENIRETDWYQALEKSGRDEILFFWFDDYRRPKSMANRKLIFAKKLNMVTHTGCAKVVKVEIDYNSLMGAVNNSLQPDRKIYLCQNGYVMLSNTGSNDYAMPFRAFDRANDVRYTMNFTLYGQDLQIYVMKSRMDSFTWLYRSLPLILALLLLTFGLLGLIMHGIDLSIVTRILRVASAFESVNEPRLRHIHGEEGTDEIGVMVRNYNQMADRTNSLIRTVYQDRLRQQESDIARQNAELLALHSQINPHFLFNCLESVRMHSVLRHEEDTADMIENLALLLRQNAEWNEDSITIEEEMKLVGAYLGLQKYRFGYRLSYEIDVADELRAVRIPKMTLVTFVENACVHGVESKTTGVWIFVRVYMEQDELCMEIEDTGEGMSEEMQADIRDRMENASIEKLKSKGRIGIVNACLRLKMMTHEEVRFILDSEAGIGTTIQIRIPKSELRMGA